jgi:NAD-dependent dihydropyrimidine dehydrogenase PreA subunit
LARKGCTGCRECLKDCTTGKPLSKLEKGFDSVECVRCYSCILACPEGTVKLKPRSAR